MADASDSQPEPKNNTALVASFITLFFLVIIGASYFAHTGGARAETVGEAVRDRLLILRPTRGMGPDAVGKIPVVRFHANNKKDNDPPASARGGRQDVRGLSATGASRPASKSTWLQNIKPIVFLSVALSRRPNTGGQAEEGMVFLPRCSICAEDYVDGDELRKLPCGHLFHQACIDPWLRDRARTCPLWYVKRTHPRRRGTCTLIHHLNRPKSRLDVEAQLASNSVLRPPRVAALRTHS